MQTQLRQAERRLERLYEALESGVLNLDETLQRRVQRAKSAREAVLVEMAGLRRFEALPLARVLPSQVERFGKLLRAKLSDPASPFAKEYLRAVVDEIVVKDREATICGSHAQLLTAVAGKLPADQVPSFMKDWRARKDKLRTLLSSGSLKYWFHGRNL